MNSHHVEYSKRQKLQTIQSVEIFGESNGLLVSFRRF